MTDRHINWEIDDEQTRNWAMALHLSCFAGYLVPMAGFIAPIVIWQVKKEQLPGIDAHGRNVTNWLISLIIYLSISVGLCFILVGIPLLIVLGILMVVFPIIGGIKASNGEAWRYPFAIRFF